MKKFSVRFKFEYVVEADDDLGAVVAAMEMLGEEERAMDLEAAEDLGIVQVEELRP